MNNITKRVSMYIRVKPEFEKDYDFKQIVIRLGYMEDPNFQNRPYSPRFIFSNFAIFLTEPNGKPHTYKHEIPVHEAWDYNRQCSNLSPYGNKREELDKYIEKLPLYWRVLDRANIVHNRLQSIVQNMKYNAYNRPYSQYDAYANHKYIEIKTSLNIIAGFILDKEPRSLDIRNMETIEDIESIKIKVSDFDHTVVVDNTMDIVEDGDIEPEDITAIKDLMGTWKEQKKNLVRDNTDNGVAVSKLMSSLSYTRRLIERVSKDDSNPTATKNNAIAPEIYKIETCLENIKQKYASLSADRDAELMEHMSIIFGEPGKKLEQALDMYVNTGR